MIPSGLTAGLRFPLSEEDGVRRCVVCQQLRFDGEDLPHGECCCASCGEDLVRCENCLHTYPRREFVTSDGIDDLCGPCAYSRDMANDSRLPEHATAVTP